MVWKISDINTLRIKHEVQPSFTSDSRFVFIASGPELRLYNVASGELVRNLKHSAVVTGICTSASSPTEVYTTTLDGTLIIWNYEDGIELVKHNMGEPIIRMKGDQETNTMVVVLKGHASKIYTMRFFDTTKLNKKDEQLQFSSHQFSELGIMTNIDICGSSIAVATRKNLVLWQPTENFYIRWPSNVIVPNTGKNRRVDLLSVALNPTDTTFMAVGDTLGNIHYLRREIQNKVYISNLQWHSYGTTALKFFADGTGFLSGGQEGTLLSWELKSYSFKKMGSVGTITQIAISPDDQYAAFLTTDNALVTLDISLLRSKSLVEGYKTEHYKTLPSDWLRSPCVRIEPQHGYIAFNGAKGYIQFYDIQTDKIVNSFEAVAPNLSAFSGHAGRQELPNAHIDHFAFSSQGTGMVLTVYRKVVLKNQHKFLENSLRFYWFSEADDKWLLETRVELPHGERISNIAYHPQKDIVVSCGEDGKFRVWNRALIKDKEGNSKHGRWVCRSVGNYKTNACSSCAFSPDGSLLAVGYDNVLTLWNPITNILLSEILHPDCTFIRHITFIADSPYVVTTTQDKLFVWNVLDSSLAWSCEANVFAIAAHPQDSTFAVSVTTKTRKIPETIEQAKEELMKKRRSYVVLFSASSPKPLYTWKLSQDKTPVALTIGRKDHTKQTGWMIVCTTAKQQTFIIEDLTAQTDEEKTDELAPLKEDRKPGYLETIMGADMEEDEEISTRADSAKQRLLFRRRDQFLSTLAETPSHVLPPMTELFRSFMETVIPKDPSLVEKTEQTPDNSKNEKAKETTNTPTVPKKKLEQSAPPAEIPSDSRSLPKQVMELVQLFQGQLVLTDLQTDAQPSNAGLTSSGKKRNETPQKEASNQPSLNRSTSKELKKKKVDEMEEEVQTNGTSEHKEAVTVGVKRTSEDRIIQGSKKESNGNHSQDNEESEGTPKSGRKQALKTSQTKSAPTTPASQPKNPKQNATPKSALRQSGSKQKQ